MSYISGKMIKELRESRHMTQKDLADRLSVSDKTVSKWETERGLPDISMLTELSSALGISVAELFAGEHVVNNNRSANMKKINFYVCPICGNIVQAAGTGSFSCCGVNLVAAELEDADNSHEIQCELIENEIFLHVNHPMEKEHYISFAAFVTSDSCSLVKFYPEQNAECRFMRKGHGFLYIYCNRHGLFRKTY